MRMTISGPNPDVPLPPMGSVVTLKVTGQVVHKSESEEGATIDFNLIEKEVLEIKGDGTNRALSEAFGQALHRTQGTMG